MATNAASPGGTVTVASNGIVSGLSGLYPGAVYYYDYTGGFSTTTDTYKIGLAVSSSSILLNSGADATSDQFFGDMIFANNFRITEGWQYPNSLIWKNQLGREIMRIDETGALSLPGMLQPLTAEFFNELSATTSVDELTASSTPDSSAPWRGSFAGASEALKDALAKLGSSIIRVFVEPIYAAVGIFDEVLAKFIHADRVETGELCVGSVCITESQLAAVLVAAGQNAISSGQGSAETSTTSSSTPSGVTSTIPPHITIAGNNPAHINVGDTYQDLGATAKDSAGHDLGLRTFLNGALVSDIVLDTSTTSTDTIDYVATDTWGNTATATRSVIIEPPAPPVTDSDSVPAVVPEAPPLALDTAISASAPAASAAEIKPAPSASAIEPAAAPSDAAPVIE